MPITLLLSSSSTCRSHQHTFPWPAGALHAVCPPIAATLRVAWVRVKGEGWAGGGAALLPRGSAYTCSFRKFPLPYEPATDLLFSDGSGTITFDEFKNVFAATLGADALPFNFDWYALLASTE